MKVLYIDKLYPFPPNDGRNIRVFNLLTQLSRSHDLTLLCNRTTGTPTIPLPITARTVDFVHKTAGYIKPIINLFSLRPYHQQYFNTKKLSAAVKECVLLQKFDVVIIDSVYLAGLIPLLHGLPVVINEHNYEPGIMLSRCHAEINPFLKIFFYLQYRKALRLQKWALRQPNVSFVCVSKMDARQIAQLNQSAVVGLVPNGVDTLRFTYSVPTDFDTVCFLGSLAWAPNVDGIDYFIKKVWPRIKRSKPNLKLLVVGQDPDKVAARYKISDIKFTGIVDDIIPYLQGTSVFVVPLRFGGGTKLKLLEAMALGRPVVTTSKGAEGIEGIENGVNAVIADDAVQFAAGINELLNDREKAVRLGLAGRKLVEQRYDWTRIGWSMDDCLTRMVTKEPAISGLLSGHDIICFSNDWNQDPLSKHHIMSRLAKQNRVLWINSIGLRNPTATRMDAVKGFNKIKNFFTNRLEKVTGNLSVLNLLVLPFHGHSLTNKINKRLLISQVWFYKSKLGFAKPILWSFLPNAESAFGQLGEELSLYYITDDFTKFTGHPARAIGRMEERLIEKADLVIASARNLVEIKGKNKKIHLIGHGVEHRHFSRALEMTDKDWPEDVKDLKRPVIGFYGEINDWLDLEMLRRAAELRPDWSFVLVGRVAVEVGDIGYLAGLKNVHLTGQKKFDQLPAYCAAFDVGLIPMKLNDLTVCVNPLKLKEYLAAGLPVVSARLPEVLAYKDAVEFAGTAEELVAAVEKLLAQNRTSLKYQLSRRVAQESWDDKVVEISKLIQTALEQKTVNRAK